MKKLFYSLVFIACFWAQTAGANAITITNNTTQPIKAVISLHGENVSSNAVIHQIAATTPITITSTRGGNYLLDLHISAATGPTNWQLVKSWTPDKEPLNQISVTIVKDKNNNFVAE